MESMGGSELTVPAQAMVTMSDVCISPQETMTAGTGAKSVDAGISVFMIHTS